MRIIGGSARNLELNVPRGLAVRPTAVRSRKALFDSSGSWCGLRVVDLFAGSGALGLEAASRGAARVTLIELNSDHLRVIAENVEKVRRTGAEFEAVLISGDAGDPAVAVSGAPADVVLADPPYANSLEHFRRLVSSREFQFAYAGGRLIWELPDAPGSSGDFMAAAEGRLNHLVLRRFGGTFFLIGVMG